MKEMAEDRCIIVHLELLIGWQVYLKNNKTKASPWEHLCRNAKDFGEMFNHPAALSKPAGWAAVDVQRHVRVESLTDPNPPILCTQKKTKNEWDTNKGRQHLD